MAERNTSVVVRPGWPDDEEVITFYVQAERLATRMVGRHSAEDVAVECVIRLLAHWSRAKNHPAAWVARVTTNLAIDEIRRRSSLSTATAGNESIEFDSSTRLVMLESLRRLSHRQREVVVLRHMLDYSIEDIASALGISESSVKTYLIRALRTLKLYSEPLRTES